MPLALAAKAGGRDPSQLGVELRHDGVRGLASAALQLLEQCRDVSRIGHGRPSRDFLRRDDVIGARSSRPQVKAKTARRRAPDAAAPELYRSFVNEGATTFVAGRLTSRQLESYPRDIARGGRIMNTRTALCCAVVLLAATASVGASQVGNTEPGEPSRATAFDAGLEHYQAGRYTQAVEALKQTIAAAPGFAPAHHQLGLAYFHLGRYAEAVGAFEHAVRLQPGWAMAHYNLGKAYQKLGRREPARKAFQRAVAIKADFAEAYNDLGVECYHAGALDEARDALERAIRLEPTFAEARANLGALHADRGHYKEAIALLEEAIRLKPDCAEAHGALGQTYLKMGRFGDAVESLTQAIRLEPEVVARHYNLALAYVGLGRREAALKQYDWVKAAAPEVAKGLLDLIYGDRVVPTHHD
jgi:tetratricopeptide (TPR) repeat protein